MLEENLKKAYNELFKRYSKLTKKNTDIFKNDEHLRIFLMTNYAMNFPENMPSEKLSRWLGFIQGVLWVYGLIDIDQERKVSRFFIHKAYINSGIEPPESVNVDK